MKNVIIPIILAFAAGAFVPVQTGANSFLSKGLGSGMLSTFMVFVVATVATALALVFQRPELPSMATVQSIPWFAWITGGILGSAYIFLLIYTAPKLGMATVVGLVVLGQMCMALLFDHFGWLDFTVAPINWKRIGGVLLMVVGLIIIKKF